VQVRIDTQEHRDVVLVPIAAVVREAEETAVFVVNGDKAERKVVTLGLEDGEHIEIKSGIKAGDQVIIKGQAGLPDGAKITATAAAEEK
jgi:multidrug efflux pump subunit AcrA (membrane-fusion protein)